MVFRKYFKSQERRKYKTKTAPKIKQLKEQTSLNSKGNSSITSHIKSHVFRDTFTRPTRSIHTSYRVVL